MIHLNVADMTYPRLVVSRMVRDESTNEIVIELSVVTTAGTLAPNPTAALRVGNRDALDLETRLEWYRMHSEKKD